MARYKQCSTGPYMTVTTPTPRSLARLFGRTEACTPDTVQPYDDRRRGRGGIGRLARCQLVTRSTLGEWWGRLGRSGWGFPAWPAEWFGKGLPPAVARAVVADRLRRAVFGPVGGIATFLAAPTILTCGNDEQKQRFMPGIATGADIWCQLFSEPGAGSDMASLQTRAVRDGDEWVVTGQKVWNSGAQCARYGILIARTDPDVPKHKGITYFLIDMDQPGVEVRPLREMTGGRRSTRCSSTRPGSTTPNGSAGRARAGGWR